MRKLAVFFVFLFYGFLPVTVSAQVIPGDTESSIVSSSADFTSEIIQDTQDPGSKEVTFYMRINSNISASRVRVTWEILGASIFTQDAIPEGTFSVDAGQTYDIPITIIPGPSGVTELSGRAEAFQVDGTLITTVRANFATNEDAEVLPITPEYEEARRNYQLQSMLQTSGIIICVVSVIVFIGLRFVKYLKRDDIVAYDQSHELS